MFGIVFSQLDQCSLVKVVTTQPVGPHPGVRLVVTANVDHVVNLRRNDRFRAAYRDAWAITADGAPVALYARLRGARCPGRVTGPDLFDAMMRALSADRHRPFFVVSRPDTGDRLRRWLCGRGFDEDAVESHCPPYGFERDPELCRLLAARIRIHRTTHLIMGIGAPKSEIWVHDWRNELGDCYAFGIGAGVDFFVGTDRRAPAAMRKLGLEWLWRLGREPRRLFRRYVVDALLFPLAVMRDLAGEETQGDPPTDRLPA